MNIEPSMGSEFIPRASEHVRKLIAGGASTREILTLLATAGEILAGEGAVTSILVLDHNGLLRNGASPNSLLN